MEANPRLHPLVAVAAASAILFSVVGTGVMTGVIPSSHSSNLRTDLRDAPPVGEAPAPRKTVVVHQVSRAPVQRVVHVERAAPRYAAAGPVCSSCGVVASINKETAPGDATGLGAIGGGVAGAVLGHQMGKGRGNTVATILGAAGGAWAGNAIEKRVRGAADYRIRVRMNDGSIRTVHQATEPGFRVGDDVRVSNGRLAVI